MAKQPQLGQASKIIGTASAITMIGTVVDAKNRRQWQQAHTYAVIAGIALGIVGMMSS